MAIAASLQDCLQRHVIAYGILEHAPAVTMRAAAHATGISEDSVVKAVLLEDEDGYVLVAVPASCHVQLGKVARLLKHPVGLASETEARSEEHTSELQSLMRISYAVFCLKKKIKDTKTER